MEKLTFYIDCDDTIFNSGQVVRKFLANNGLEISENEDPYEIYYNLYPEERNNPKFQCLYDMQEIYPVFDYAIKVLKYLESSIHDVFAITCGQNIDNAYHKIKWFSHYGLKDMGFIFIPFNTDKQKSVVNMEGAVFIDNQENYLNNSNAGNKILFGKENFENFYVRDWIELFVSIKRLESGLELKRPIPSELQKYKAILDKL